MLTRHFHASAPSGTRFVSANPRSSGSAMSLALVPRAVRQLQARAGSRLPTSSASVLESACVGERGTRTGVRRRPCALSPGGTRAHEFSRAGLQTLHAGSQDMYVGALRSLAANSRSMTPLALPT
eukprot:1327732-Rhodomonas_salina.3